MHAPSFPARLSGQLLLGALLAALVGSVVVIALYGWSSFLPGLVVGFGASLAAFVLALSWERDQELQRHERGAAAVEARHASEVERRLTSVQAELEVNRRSLKELNLVDPRLAGAIFIYQHPQLLDGAWTANAPRLSELLADYELVGDLAITYGRIEELRWRLRFRSERQTMDLDPATIPLVEELRAEVADRLNRVGDQIEAPTVQPLGFVHQVSGGGGSAGGISPTGSGQIDGIRSYE